MSIKLNDYILFASIKSGGYVKHGQNIPHEEYNERLFDDGKYYAFIPPYGNPSPMKEYLGKPISICFIRHIDKCLVTIEYIYINAQIVDESLIPNLSINNKKIREYFINNSEIKSKNLRLLTYWTNKDNFLKPSFEVILNNKNFGNARFLNPQSQRRYISKKEHKEVYDEILSKLNKCQYFKGTYISEHKIYSTYVRNSNVSEEVKHKANGICKMCMRKISKNEREIWSYISIPELQCHHIVPLSKGGEDKVSNCEALCPNCHRMKHIQMKNDYE